jgi:hypothetical protein
MVEVTADAQGFLDDCHKLAGQVTELVATLRTCSDDLEGELRARYNHPYIHPSLKRKFERDMAPVYEARALLHRLKILYWNATLQKWQDQPVEQANG